MPDISRMPLRMDCPNGLDLTHPIDRQPPGSFPYASNIRIVEEGRFDGRPGYTDLLALGDHPNSVRRLNDPDRSVSADGYIYVGGGGNNLYAGPIGAYTSIDSGYSGDPLSLIPFRPEGAPESQMYVYDRSKQVRVRPDKTIQAIGVSPPVAEPSIEYGSPATADVHTGQSSGFSASGIAGAITTPDRTNGSTASISSIKYNSGTTGWSCINPTMTGQPFWAGERMKVILNTGGGNVETVVVREIHPAITATTIAGIQYDTGSTGLCSIVLTSSPAEVSRNSLISIGGEVIRVLEVVLSPDGTAYSLRCSAANTHAAGNAVTGLISWYVYTLLTHAAAETITSTYVAVVQASAGVGGIVQSVAADISASNGRQVDPANDYLHISMYFVDPSVLVNVELMLALDSTPTFSFTNPGNAWVYTLPASQIQGLGSSASSWVEIVIPLSSGVRSGSDLTRTLASINGVAIQLTTTGACNWGFDWWYLFGTYGPVIQPNAPTGYSYQYRYRNFTVGVKSVPGPLTRYQLFPLREDVIITPTTPSQAGVDTMDIYRLGGTIDSPLYVGSLNAANVFLTDTLPDVQILQVNQPPDLTALQPWPIQQLQWSGTCNVAGTSVVWVSGNQFDTNLIGNTVIVINGIAYQTYGQPHSSTFLELTQDAGNSAGAIFLVSSPTLAAQPLPYVFGPLEGPFSPTILALGDPINGGLLYYSNFSDADSAADTNTLELSTPSSDLVSGCVHNGLIFCGSRSTIFVVRFSYLSSIGAASPSFQWAKVPAPSGIWSRWACCECPLGMAYLGQDGIYIATESGGVNITNERLYPLFPHEGQPATAVSVGGYSIYPVDMTAVTKLRLTYCDERLEFCYPDTSGAFQNLQFDIKAKRWLWNTYADHIGMKYLVEDPAVDNSSGSRQQQILMTVDNANRIELEGGNLDITAPISSLVLTPSMDGGDERTQKLVVDSMTIAGGAGTIVLAASFDNAQSYSPTLNIACGGSIQQSLQNIASLANLALHKNVGAKFSWSGGPSGPQLYAWEISAYPQPYLSTHLVTQFLSLAYPGWKSYRRMYPSLISTAPVTFTIKCQDGRSFTYTIPSTGGQFKVQPQMLDHGIKDLAFALELDGGGVPFAIFQQEFTSEVKEWVEPTYIQLALLRT